MSTPDPEGPNPFEGLPLFGDIARMFAHQGPVNWDVAAQMAAWVATEGESEANVDPAERLRLEELMRVAELRVSAITGLPSTLSTVSGGLLEILAVTRTDWAARTLKAYRRFLERLSSALAAGQQGGVAPDPSTQLMGDLTKVLGPVLLGVQSGCMVGHLARRGFGQYDLPLPRPPTNQLLIVPANLGEFTAEWSLPPDDLRLWVLLREVTVHTVLARTHVRSRLEALIFEYVGGFQVDPGALESSLADIDPTDPSGLQAVLGNPETLLGVIQSPAQRGVLVQISTLVGAIEGYVDYVLDSVGTSLIGSYPMLSEALRRRRVEAGPGDRFVAQIFGLELGRQQYDRGEAFVKGVVERGGEAGLARLWNSERELPTSSELDAPGLWLARIDLPRE